MWRDGRDLRRRPLLERKAALAELLRRPPDRLLCSDHVSCSGRALFEKAGTLPILVFRAELRGELRALVILFLGDPQTSRGHVRYLLGPDRILALDPKLGALASPFVNTRLELGGVLTMA